MQAVEVEPIEARLAAPAQRVVVRAEPSDEIQHVCIAPHPRGKASEPAQRLGSVGVTASAANISIHAISIRPIRLDRDHRKPLFLNQAFGDLRAVPIELVRPMRCLAEEDETRIADELEQDGRSPR